jgi:hypothetical protein
MQKGDPLQIPSLAPAAVERDLTGLAAMYDEVESEDLRYIGCASRQFIAVKG